MLNRKRFAFILTGSLLLLTLFLAGIPSFADSGNTRERTVTRLADGIYEIRHPDAPDTFPQGNTTVIIGDREVFVVDSCYLPSSAREDIAQIRQWTSKPVRYLLNTHWHYDHTMGNVAYRDAFPGLAVIAQVETRKQEIGRNRGWLERFPARGEQLKQQLAVAKNPNGKPFTEGEIADFNKAIRGIAPVQVEYKDLLPRVDDLTPDLAFDHDTNFDLGNREVQVKFLGRANTAGDAVVFLPKEKIVIAGDVIDHPIPYLGGGFPDEQIVTLRNLAALNPETIVPGHGDVLHGTAYLNMLVEFLQDVVGAVGKELYVPANSATLEDMRKAVEKDIDVAAWRKKFAGDDKDDQDFFDDFSLEGVVKAAYYKMTGR